jgi:hypothetical protein
MASEAAAPATNARLAHLPAETPGPVPRHRTIKFAATASRDAAGTMSAANPRLVVGKSSAAIHDDDQGRHISFHFRVQATEFFLRWVQGTGIQHHRGAFSFGMEHSDGVWALHSLFWL